MGRYYMLHTYTEGEEKLLQILDLEQKRVIRLTMGSIERNEIEDPDLHSYLYQMLPLIRSGYWG